MSNSRQASRFGYPFEREYEKPPFQAHSETSEKAADAMHGISAEKRRQVLKAFLDHGPMTDEEVQELLGMNPSTERPRRVELVDKGCVRNSGRQRMTRSGRWAVVWEAVQI